MVTATTLRESTPWHTQTHKVMDEDDAGGDVGLLLDTENVVEQIETHRHKIITDDIHL